MFTFEEVLYLKVLLETDSIKLNNGNEIIDDETKKKLKYLNNNLQTKIKNSRIYFEKLEIHYQGESNIEKHM